MVCANNGGSSPPHYLNAHQASSGFSARSWIKLVPLRFQQPQRQMLWHGSLQHQPLFLDFSLPALRRLNLPSPLVNFFSASFPSGACSSAGPSLQFLLLSSGLMQFFWSHGTVPSTERQLLNLSLCPNPKCPSTWYLRWESKPQAWHPLIKFG